MMQTDKEYAEALFMLASEENQVEDYGEALSVIDKVVEENPEYLEFLGSPAISLEERLAAVDEAFGTLPEDVVSFVKILCENRHINILPECVKAYYKLKMALSGRAVANIYSSVELSKGQQKNICDKLRKVTGKEIDRVYIIDESLIGGVKIDVEGKTYDGSIKSRLDELKKRLSETIV